ncbi:hypothetical protein PC121_g20033 [Phytophthora cactorum]|nr:hypothetical protein PC121_g20033 [Phytophthora cactorum]
MQERVQDVERRSAKEATAYDEVDVVVAALDAGRRTRREQQSREARAELERQQQLRNSQGDDRRGGERTKLWLVQHQRGTTEVSVANEVRWSRTDCRRRQWTWRVSDYPSSWTQAQGTQ